MGPGILTCTTTREHRLRGCREAQTARRASMCKKKQKAKSKNQIKNRRRKSLGPGILTCTTTREHRLRGCREAHRTKGDRREASKSASNQSAKKPTLQVQETKSQEQKSNQKSTDMLCQQRISSTASRPTHPREPQAPYQAQENASTEGAQQRQSKIKTNNQAPTWYQ